MKNPKVSIIVPVYNVERFIHKCLESITAQTYSNWECLLVIDGSTDKSADVCKEFAKTDSRYKVLEKENEGVAMARKLGMDQAAGDFMIHVDPDDYIEANMLEEMVSEILKANTDILITDFYKNYEGGQEVYVSQCFSGNTCKQLSEEILYQRLHGSLWNKLMRSSIYHMYRPMFFSEINHSEDVLIWVQLSNFDVTVSYHPKAFYHYCFHDNCGITRNYTKETYNARKIFLQKLRSFDLLKDAVDCLVFYIKLEAFLQGVMTYHEYYNFERTKIKSVLHSNNSYYKALGLMLYFRLYYTALFFSKALRYINKMVKS